MTPTLAIDEEQLRFEFIRASGPGGQKVNKASTAVQLRFDAGSSPSLPEDVRERLAALAGRRMSSDGILVIEASRHRSQRQNREEALQRLLALLREAARPRRRRRPTSPGPRQRAERLRRKRARGQTKHWRRGPSPHEE